MRLILILFIVFTYSIIHSQIESKFSYTISGNIYDSVSKERLIGVNIFEEYTQIGSYSNDYSFFSITLPTDTISLLFSSVGYETKKIKIFLNKDTTINVFLFQNIQLETVEISSIQNDEILKRANPGVINLASKEVQSLPAILGEPDILKVVQLLPGVQSGVEGLSGFHVRGGSHDQNLILVDGIPIYNSSHLLGLFSTFNPDIIKSTRLFKSSIPARYGGRLSSVLDVKLKDGNMEEYHGKISVGLMASKIYFEGPIQKQKNSVLLSFRRSYVDIFLKSYIRLQESEINDLSLNFYDLNLKLQQKINDKNRLYINSYSGNDVFGLGFEELSNSNTSLIKWNNKINSIKLNSELSPKLYLNTSLNFSTYTFLSELGFENTDASDPSKFIATYNSKIRELSNRIDFDYAHSPMHYFKFGAALTSFAFVPGINAIIQSNDNSTIENSWGDSTVLSRQVSVYVEDDFSFKRLNMNVGFRTVFYTEDASFFSFQPRLAFNYRFTDKWSLKASVSKNQQFVHLLSSESIVLPTDIWVPSASSLLPQESMQYTLGASSLHKNIEGSIELFYKNMDNVVSYKEGISFISDFQSTYLDLITQGKGQSFGAEIFLQKRIGNLTGWVAYTLSKNTRQFDEINGGIKYPYKYDRTHDFKIALVQKFSNRLQLSGTWVFGTGNAITLPDKFIELEGGHTVELASSRNNFRMSSFHKLDLGISLKKKKKHLLRTWSFGVYNAYFHVNPIYVRQVNNQGLPKYQEVGFLPLIPNVSLSYEF